MRRERAQAAGGAAPGGYAACVSRRGMRLVEIIDRHRDEIMEQWVRFAATLVPPDEHVDYDRLRDHGDELLAALILDTVKRTDECGSMTLESSDEGATERLTNVGKVHATSRMASGFSLPHVVREYRALRSSVLSSVFRLWGTGPMDLDGLLRFNEAIGQALMEAVVEYADRTTQYRDEVVGVVSHDLRNPLAAILIWAGKLGRQDGGEDVVRDQATKIVQSARRMTRIVSDLLDLTRVRFGLSVPISRAPADAGQLASDMVDEIRATYPNATIRLSALGDLHGCWDGERIEQVIGNLLSNALQHGDPTRPITVSLAGSGQTVTIAVHNEGAIPDSLQAKIFQSGFRGDAHPPAVVHGLGLGLYIVKKIVLAHDGEIHVASTKESGTTFTIRLPRGD